MMENTTKTPNEEIRRALQTINIQLENWLNSKRPISLLEKDLLKENIRSFYQKIDGLILDQPDCIPSFEKEIQKSESDFQNQVSPKASISEEVISNLRKTEFVVENNPIAKKEVHAETHTPIYSSTVQEMIQNATVINSVEQLPSTIENTLSNIEKIEETPIVKRGIEEKTIEARIQEVKAATRFEEVRTIGSTYAPGESVSDKINRANTGKSISEKLKSQPLVDLKLSIGINERFAFINELFHGDQQLYQQSIERINSMNVYDQAKIIIHEELMGQLNWKQDHQRFQEFDELIKRRFNA
ncbi:MAG: hypothetical protein IPK10_11265 [Bacteroidetes bacterium]|nr:hypothetical protein [Bacteroidota bacterium]